MASTGNDLHVIYVSVTNECHYNPTDGVRAENNKWKCCASPISPSSLHSFSIKKKIKKKLQRTQGKNPSTTGYRRQKSMTSCVDNDDGDEWKLVWPTLLLPHLLVLMCLI